MDEHSQTSGIWAHLLTTSLLEAVDAEILKPLKACKAGEVAVCGLGQRCVADVQRLQLPPGLSQHTASVPTERPQDQGHNRKATRERQIRRRTDML
jgi:hypothetical protein